MEKSDGPWLEMVFPKELPFHSEERVEYILLLSAAFHMEVWRFGYRTDTRHL